HVAVQHVPAVLRDAVQPERRRAGWDGFAAPVQQQPLDLCQIDLRHCLSARPALPRQELRRSVEAAARLLDQAGDACHVPRAWLDSGGWRRAGSMPRRWATFWFWRRAATGMWPMSPGLIVC